MKKSIPIAALLLLSIAASFADTTNAAPAPAVTNAAPVAPPPPAGPVLAPTNDAGISSDGKVQDQDSYQARIGELYAPAIPAGQRIATIHLRAQLVGMDNEGGALGNADLYALGIRDTDKLLPTDYYEGPGPDPKAMLLQAKFLTPSSKVRTDPNTGPFVETSADGDAALAKYLNDAIAIPANTGKFVFLRVSYDVDPIPTGNNAYMLLTSGASGDNEPPIFTYTLRPK
jgi:hypothetical protein